MYLKSSIKILIFILLFSISSVTFAGIKKLNIQGKITQNDGVTPSTGTHTITFKLYDSYTGGTTYYAETQIVNLSTTGLFNCMLGQGTIAAPNPNVPFDNVSFDKQYYVAMNIDSEGEMTNRQLLGASAYALGSIGNFSVAGNMGIGTSNPTAKMEVVSSSQNVRIRIQSINAGGSETAGATLADAGGDEWSLYYSNALKGLVVNEEGLVPRMFIKDGGNVGIGTTNPGYNLEIDSSNPALNLKDSGDNHYLRTQIVNDGGEMIQYGNTTAPFFRFINATNNIGEIRFRTVINSSATDKMVIKNNGRVGIGDTDPSQPLVVVGSNEALHVCHISSGGFTFMGFDENQNFGRMGSYGYGAWKPLILQQWGGTTGTVGIGTGNNPPTNLLQMESIGGGYYSATDHDWHKGLSSVALKSNITDYGITNIIDTLNGLKIKKYQYKDNVVIKNAEGKEIGTELRVPAPDKPYCIGYIAEEVPKDLNDLVISNEGNISIGSSFSYLVLVCQEQQKQIEDLKAQVEQLKTQIK